MKTDEPKPAKVRREDEASFIFATVRGAFALLKTDRKARQGKLAAAERRADESARKFELLPLVCPYKHGRVASPEYAVLKVRADRPFRQASFSS
ncbi:MAG: hypothetical protein WAO35_27910 [Terriglobia bacterium]